MECVWLGVKWSVFDRDRVRARIHVAGHYFPIPLEIHCYWIAIEPARTPVTRPGAANRIWVLLRQRRQEHHERGSQTKKGKKCVPHSTSAKSAQSETSKNSKYSIVFYNNLTAST